jgi:protein-S-isoprenylcysteine O-methyltransferase Ste14
LKIFSVVLFVGCLVVFARARAKFFDRSAGEDRGRIALARMGTLAGILLPVNAVYPLWLIAQPMYGAGIALFVGSISLFYLSTRAHGKQRPGIAYSVRPPGSLVYHGPYRFVRHPIYTSYILCWFGSFLIGPTVGALALVGLIVYMYYLTVRFEEGVIDSSDLAEQYAMYKARTGMFFPVIRLSRSR